MIYRELAIKIPVPAIKLEKIIDWFAQHKTQLADAIKIGGLVLLLVFVPVGMVKPQPEVKVSGSVQLKKGLFPVVAGEAVPVVMEWGPSNHERAQQQASKESRQVVARDRVATYTDPGLEAKRAIYARIAAAYGLSPALLEAVHQVESGKAWGPTRRSPAGARGPMQFLPATFRRYADPGWDINNPEHAIEAAARLLAANGAAEGDIDRALYAYNHSWAYVRKVKEVADSI